jgi:hypothetical protein
LYATVAAGVKIRLTSLGRMGTADRLAPGTDAPIIEYEITKARIADRQRQAEQAAIARAARLPTAGALQHLRLKQPLGTRAWFYGLSLTRVKLRCETEAHGFRPMPQ